jgi:hypothetical protein
VGNIVYGLSSSLIQPVIRMLGIRQLTPTDIGGCGEKTTGNASRNEDYCRKEWRDPAIKMYPYRNFQLGRAR